MYLFLKMPDFPHPVAEEGSGCRGVDEAAVLALAVLDSGVLDEGIGLSGRVPHVK